VEELCVEELCCGRIVRGRIVCGRIVCGRIVRGRIVALPLRRFRQNNKIKALMNNKFYFINK
jgi:hypothetical protein